MKKFIAICALLCFGQLGFAQDVFQEFVFPADFILKNKESINLTPRQETRIKAIHNEQQSLFSRKKAALQQETDQLKILLNEENAKASIITAQLDKVLSKENELKKLQFETLLNMRNELNSKQVAQLKELRQNESSSGISLQNNEVVSIHTKGADAEKSPTYYIKYQDKYHKITEINSIQPENIESISVLKGKAAIEQFGNEANNGVIIITLKDPATIDFDKLK